MAKDRPPLRAVKRDEAPSKAKEQTTKPQPSSARRGSLQQRTEAMIGSIALAVSVWDFADGAIIMEAAPDMAESWVTLADANPRVKRTMEKALSGGAWGGVIMVHGTVALKILQNHGVIGELTFPLGGSDSGNEKDGRSSGDSAGNPPGVQAPRTPRADSGGSGGAPGLGGAPQQPQRTVP